MDYLSSLIFEKYKEIHGDFSQTSDQKELQEQYDFFAEKNYSRYLKNVAKNAPILEIGSYLGHHLKWLQDNGFTNLHGVELDKDACDFSKKYCNLNNISNCNIKDYIKKSDQKFDVILMKATLEHFEREEIPEILQGINDLLNSNGLVIISVPNMDWLMASHERYMDLTHRMGFTQESLAALLRLFFRQVQVEPFIIFQPLGRWQFWQIQKRKFAIWFLRKLFLMMGEAMASPLFEYRSIQGIGYKK